MVVIGIFFIFIFVFSFALFYLHFLLLINNMIIFLILTIFLAFFSFFHLFHFIGFVNILLDLIGSTFHHEIWINLMHSKLFIILDVLAETFGATFLHESLSTVLSREVGCCNIEAIVILS